MAVLAVFLNVYPVFAKPDEPSELDHARNVIRACRSAGVKRIVYASATRVSDYPKMKADGRLEAGSHLDKYFQSKYSIQEEVMTAGFESWTILQPAWLMSNLLSPSAKLYFPELADEWLLKTAFQPETKLQVLDPKDFGTFGAAALTDGSGKWNGKVLPLAGQEVTMTEIAETFNKCLGNMMKRSVRVEYMVGEERERKEELNPIVAAQIWISETGLGVDLEAVKRYRLPIGALEDYLMREKTAMDEALKA
jgi:uncharacterized protein YbjT (DUF2867 family)